MFRLDHECHEDIKAESISAALVSIPSSQREERHIGQGELSEDLLLKQTE